MRSKLAKLRKQENINFFVRNFKIIFWFLSIVTIVCYLVFFSMFIFSNYNFLYNVNNSSNSEFNNIKFDENQTTSKMELLNFLENLKKPILSAKLFELLFLIFFGSFLIIRVIAKFLQCIRDYCDFKKEIVMSKSYFLLKIVFNVVLICINLGALIFSFLIISHSLSIIKNFITTSFVSPIDVAYNNVNALVGERLHYDDVKPILQNLVDNWSNSINNIKTIIIKYQSLPSIIFIFNNIFISVWLICAIAFAIISNIQLRRAFR